MHGERLVGFREEGSRVEGGGWSKGYVVVQQEALVMCHPSIGHPSIRGLPNDTLQGMRGNDSHMLS